MGCFPKRIVSIMEPMDEAAAREILRAEEAEAEAFARKLELLTKLVEKDQRLDAEPGFVYLLIAFYKEDPRAMELLPAVCAYEARKYPETRDSAVSYLEMIATRLEILKKDPAEAERRWASCSRLRPAAHAEAERARRLFELMRERSGPMPPPGPRKPERHVSYGAPEPED
jgi:hypothetical protein